MSVQKAVIYADASWPIIIVFWFERHDPRLLPYNKVGCQKVTKSYEKVYVLWAGCVVGTAGIMHG